jgi:hypothetical protein
MKITILWLFVCLSSAAFAQHPPVESQLLDRLVGKWVSQAEIGSHKSMRDIEGEWVIQHHYLRLHEVSREKDAKGNARYEAMEYLTTGPGRNQIQCVWLDVFAGGEGLTTLGVADTKENDIPFTFKDDKGEVNFTNDFAYNPKTDSWKWIMNNVNHGKAIPFGTETLSRPAK